jgi:hypothetical protein
MADMPEFPSIVPARPTAPAGLAGSAAVATARETEPSHETAAQRLSRVEDREELASAVVTHASGRMPRCILFGVKADVAYLWDWSGIDLNPAKVAGMEIPVIGGSAFELLQGDEIYWGPVPDDGSCEVFYDALSIRPPVEALLLPVYLNDRLVAMLYGEGTDEEPIRGDRESWRQLAAIISMSLNMIVLKMKIRAL